MDIKSVLTITKGEIMINNVSNSQVSFSGHRHPLHALNRLSRKTCGELALVQTLGPEIVVATLVRTTIKNKISHAQGVGKTGAGAARDALRRMGVKQGVTLIVDIGTPQQAEFFVKQGKHGLIINKIA